jgi:hypothetical protein
LVKTDASGNEQWHRTYGSNSYDDSRVMDVLMTSDTNYIITGGLGFNSGGDFSYYMKILDQDFNLLNTITSNSSKPISSYTQIKEINDGYICMGEIADLSYQSWPTLIKFDNDFNELWQRRYTAGDTTETNHFMYSVDTCADGGYVMGGWAVHFGQKLALIKTDSMGCDGTDWWACNTGVAIHEYASNPEFYIYPNPVAEGNNVQCVIGNVQLSSLREGTTKQSIDVYNLTGKLVKQVQIQNSSQKIQIDDLVRGVYFVKVGEQMQKLIIDN